MGWQWHEPGHIKIICISLQTDNHASTSPLSFYSVECGCPSCNPTNSVKALKAIILHSNSCNWLTSIICWWLDASSSNLDFSKAYNLVCTARSSHAFWHSATNNVLRLSRKFAVCMASSECRFKVIINSDCSSMRDRSRAFSECLFSDKPRCFNGHPVTASLPVSSLSVSYKNKHNAENKQHYIFKVFLNEN